MLNKIIFSLVFIYSFSFTIAAQVYVTEVPDSVLNNLDVNGISVDTAGRTLIFGEDRILTYDNGVMDDFSCESCYNIQAMVSYQDIQYIANSFGGIIKRQGDSLELVADYDASTLVVDQNGNLYGNDYNNGFFRWNGTTWQNWNEDNSNLPSKYVYDLAVDANGLVWLATYAGLVSFNGTSFSLKSIPNELSATFYNIGITNDNAVWVASAYGGLGRFANNSWTTFPQTFNVLQLVQDVAILNGTEVWTSSFEKGLYRYTNNHFVNYTPTELGYPDIFGCSFLFGDQQGRLWMKFDFQPLLYLTLSPTAVHDIDTDLTFAAFPNPAQSTITFSLSDDQPGINEISLYSPDGKCGFHASYPGSKTVVISLADMMPGLYFAEVRDARGNTMTQPLVIRTR